MFCNHCGKEIDDKAIICVNCGVPTLNFANKNQSLNEQPVEKKANPIAIVGFVLSLVGFLFGWIFYFSHIPVYLLIGFIFFAVTIAGLVLSIIGAVKSKKLGSGGGFAIAGVVLSALELLHSLFVLYVFILLFVS